MKANKILFSSRMVTLALAFVFTFTIVSCGGSEDGTDEPSGNFNLSEETTPVAFELKAGRYYVFDYSGSQYIGSDTIDEYHGIPDEICKVEIPLRRGSHHLIWIKALEGGGWGDSPNAIYSPQSKTIETTKNGRKLQYAECDVKVSEYLLPVQKLEWKYLTASIIVHLFNEYSTLPDIPIERNKNTNVGKIKGFPVVRTISISDNKYQLSEETEERDIIAYYDWTKNIIKYTVHPIEHIMCPEEGLTIQLTTEAYDKEGKALSTSQPIAIPLRRGYTTEVWGPLFPSPTGFWTFELIPYED